jgi:hypothetical protein
MENLLPVTDAKFMVKTYLENKSTVLKQEYLENNILSNTITYGVGAFKRLLDNPNCTQIRMYYGMNEKLEITSIFVGVDQEGNEILIQNDDNLVEVTEYTIDEGLRCPPTCESNSKSCLI